MSRNSTARSTLSAVDALEASLAPAEFETIRRLLKSHAGIQIADNKQSLVYSRLAKRLRTLGLPNFAAYCAFVESAAGADEFAQMIAALTTNVTSFFREQHHFEILRDQLLPTLVERARNGGKVRIWSAGCSNGQEPYSIAVQILDVAPDAGKLDIRILATDIDFNMLAHARNGEYTERDVASVPQTILSRFFEQTANGYTVGDAAKSLVNFKSLNLVKNWPVRGPFDVIFCRNVVIYFDDETKEQIWERFDRVLAPGGSLFIGHSERVAGPAAASLQHEGPTAYRKVKSDISSGVNRNSMGARR